MIGIICKLSGDSHSTAGTTAYTFVALPCLGILQTHSLQQMILTRLPDPTRSTAISTKSLELNADKRAKIE